MFFKSTSLCVSAQENRYLICLILQSQGRGCKGVHRGSTGSVFGQSNDELSSPPASELMPVVTCAEGTDLEEALREISREISSEFSCARDTDPGTSPGPSLISGSRSEYLVDINAKSKTWTPRAVVANVQISSTLGVEVDWSSDVRRRIQGSSYIQEQYVLTRCSLSSEQSLQTQSHSHIHASSNSDSAGGAFLPDPHSSGSVLDTGSLPQGLEKMPPPEQRSSLSRWADSAWQPNLSVETSDNGAEKVRLIVIDSP